MKDVVLVQPASGGRISGGYLYNERMATHGAWSLRSVGPGAMGALASEWREDTLVLFDSIWLGEPEIDFFFEQRKKGRRVGVMLHSFPSMIRAAEAGAPLLTRPTSFELEALERLGFLVTLGEHYPNMMRGRKVRVLLAPPGVDDAWRAPPRQRGARCRLVSVGGVTRRKGFLDAARALGDLGRDDFEWSVVGSLEIDVGYAEAVRHAVAGLQNVRFLGQLPPERVRELVLHSDLLVMPSYDENHPLVLVEAIAASVPAVAYAAGAAETILGHDQCGLVSPIGNVARLAEHLDRVISNEAVRLRLAEACFRRRAEFPSWPVAARRAREQLESVV